MFWRGCTGRSEQGLELSLLSVIDLKSNTAYALDAEQTLDEDGKTRVDLYGEQVVRLAKKILDLGITYLAVARSHATAWECIHHLPQPNYFQ